MLERGWNKGNHPPHWWECKLIQTLWRTVWRFLKKLGIELPHDPTTPLLGIYPEKTRIEKVTCTPVFIAALLTISRPWKQLRCPSTDEWIKKLWYLYAMEYYSTIKMVELESVLVSLSFRVKLICKRKQVLYINTYV